ncbi:hypothetical protein FEM48_Zijuj06G0075700 [Ziziphus jujuba var. spinosa]|uniref:RBR-type E3 ubiquitin transferase n=1 Tax=Ziziphus jujuba var. spinosa TaxID=714518 RepID=A0A978V801_ZIZJJ|nr:hypothetical protein FEM48_Zijuj06G0075700 [Ziziphus jujuba var. spinosa]
MDSKDINFHGGKSSGEEDAEEDFSDDTVYADSKIIVEEDDHAINGLQKNHTTLKEQEILRLLEDDISNVSATLFISKASACTLLCHYNWNISKVYDHWFSDVERVREKVGFLEKPVVESKPSGTTSCGHCLKHYNHIIYSASCGHSFCEECWAAYIRMSIDQGPACLTLRCPRSSCNAAVDRDMINALASQEEKDKYSNYLFTSYIENNDNLKWSPVPCCNSVVSDGSNESYDVSCPCSDGYCLNCCIEIHHPTNCETAMRWILEMTNKAEITERICFPLKEPCYGCREPIGQIEKEFGCKMITCRPHCQYFCCSKCSKRRHDCACNSDHDKVKERYIHCCEGWKRNKYLKEKAIKNLHQLRTRKLEELSEIQCQPEIMVRFIAEAWQAIIECRTVLQWTYTYGYYLHENEEGHLKKHLFEFLLGQAELNLEKFHGCAAKGLQDLLTIVLSSKHFNDFRAKLVDLTKVTKNYVKELVSAWKE